MGKALIVVRPRKGPKNLIHDRATLGWNMSSTCGFATDHLWTWWKVLSLIPFLSLTGLYVLALSLRLKCTKVGKMGFCLYISNLNFFNCSFPSHLLSVLPNVSARVKSWACEKPMDCPLCSSTFPWKRESCSEIYVANLLGYVSVWPLK